MGKLNHVFTKRRLSVFEGISEDDVASEDSNDATEKLSLSHPDSPFCQVADADTPCEGNSEKMVKQKHSRKVKRTVVMF